MKSVKDSPTMLSVFHNVQSTLYSNLGSISNIECPIFQDTHSIKQVIVNDQWCKKNELMKYEQLAQDTAQHIPVKIRKEALNIFNQVVLTEAVSHYNWPEIRLNIRENLSEKNLEIFTLSLKIHAKLMQSSSPVCVVEGLINLVEGMQLYYSDNYNSLPSFKSGIDLHNSTHHHLVHISHLILQTMKEISKHWLRYGERRAEEIVEIYVALLAKHTCESILHFCTDILHPFHFIAVLDPKASWCSQWVHGVFGQQIFFNTISQYPALIAFLVEEVLEYLEPTDNYRTENLSKYRIMGHSIKSATFLHSLSILSNIVCYEKGQNLFPVVLKSTNEPFSLENFLVKMISLLNASSYCRTESNIRLHTSEIAMKFIKKVLQNTHDKIFNILIKAVMNIIQSRNIHSNETIKMPYGILGVLYHLMEDSTGIFFLLGKGHNHKLTLGKCTFSENCLDSSLPVTDVRKCQTLIISSYQQQFATRIQAINNTEVLSPARIVEYITTDILKNQDNTLKLNMTVFLIDFCSKLYSLHEGLSMLDAVNSELINTVIVSYKSLFSARQSSQHCAMSNHHTESKDYNTKSDLLFGSITKFLTAVASTPQGLFAVAQEETVLRELLKMLLNSHKPWGNPELRYLISLMTLVPQAVDILSEESDRILSRPLGDFLGECEDPVTLMTGSERKRNETTEYFMNIIFGFASSLHAVMALFSDFESGSSEGTLVEVDPGPTNLSELLSFDSTSKPWHRLGLLTLRALATNMDVCLYLDAKLKFQEKILKLQSENVTSGGHHLGSEDFKNISDGKSIIIDECSILRLQILAVATGDSSEPTLPQAITNGEQLDEYVLQNLPASRNTTVMDSRPELQTEFQRFLHNTKEELHNANWLSHARRAYKKSRNEEIKACVLIDLIDEVSKLSSNLETILSSSELELEDNTLFQEESLGVQLVIKYGLRNNLLQEDQQNEDSLSQLLQLTRSLCKGNETFQGFDWFAATMFLLCGGNLEKCRSCLRNISVLQVAPFLWPARSESRHALSQHSTVFGHVLELLIKTELPLAFSALQLAGVSWWLVCRQWMAQCFWNKLDWAQVCHWLVVCVLNQPDYLIYFCVSLLQHIQPRLLQAATEGKVWGSVLFGPMKDFQVRDYLPYMEKLAKRYHTFIIQYMT